MERWKENLIYYMPKAELHLHLDGCVRIKTAMELTGEKSWENMFRQMVLPGPVGSQSKLLSYFDVPTRVLQTKEALRRVAREMIEDKAADNVSYCEIRWAPGLHTMGGLTIEEGIEAVIEGCREGESKTGVKWVLIAVALRTLPLKDNLAMLEAVRKYQKEGIVAADFAGLEENAPDPMDQLEYFQKAREYGFAVTLHCGELASSLPYLNQALEHIRPDRIAHGAIAVGDEALCQKLKERDIMLDVCPTSNIQAGLYPDILRYPLKTLKDRGVPVSLNTDDQVLSDITLTEEYIRQLKHGGLTIKDCWQLNRLAMEHAFAPKAQKDELLRQFDTWAATVQELQEER